MNVLKIKSLSAIIVVFLTTPGVIATGENGAGIAITLFSLVIAGGLFLLSYFVDFSQNDYLNLIIKRSLFATSFWLMGLTSAVVATIAANAGVPVTNELYTYLFLFNWTGYLLIFFIMVKSMFDIRTLWKVKRATRL